MDSLCLTGQGKGRLEYSRRRHVFNYESLWEPGKSQWSLALSLPLIGQELIRFDFSDKRNKVSGKGRPINEWPSSKILREAN